MKTSLFFTLFKFHAMWRELLDWLLGAEKTLDAHQQVGNDPIKIKEEIAKHKVSIYMTETTGNASGEIISVF